MEKISKWLPIISTIMLFMILVNTCSMGRKQSIVLEKIESIEKEKDTVVPVTSKEIEKLLQKNMYESLILEEDIDKGNISISEIKKKVIEEDLK